MKLLTLDFESYYDKQYNLRKVTTAEYILSPAFEAICLAAQVEDGPIEFVDGPDISAFLAQHPPDDTITLTYNSLFDNCILAWRYNYVPKLMIDGLGMARYCLGHRMRRLGLEQVVAELAIGIKDVQVIQSVLGMHRVDIMERPALWESYKDYVKNDVYLLKEVFRELAPKFPASEYSVMDLVLRCAVQPQFLADVDLLQRHYTRVCSEKEELIAATGVTREQLSSSAEFEKILESYGISVDYKYTNTGNYIPALAKTDEFMKSLEENEDPYVAALAAARLGAKSTLEEKRSERLIKIALSSASHAMPIPLRYAGAHTQRLSGEWKINLQNLPTGRNGREPFLRKSLKAPEGYSIISADFSQIEARLVAWFCGASILFDAFVTGKDPYSLMAAYIFGMEITDPKGEHALYRFVGKAATLGLGYGLGPDNFFLKTLQAARGMGMDMNSFGQMWTPALATRAVETYRKMNPQIPSMWHRLDGVLRHEWAGSRPPARLGPLIIGHGYVEGPGGLRMQYVVPEEKRSDGELFYEWGGRVRKIYGGSCLENIAQFLARIIICSAWVRLSKLGFRAAHQVHDELVFIVPTDDLDNALRIIYNEMIQIPSWAPTLPLAAEIGSGKNYGETK